jgi:hypothetical protein
MMRAAQFAESVEPLLMSAADRARALVLLNTAIDHSVTALPQGRYRQG